MNPGENLKSILEAALLAAGRPLSLDAIQGLFSEIEQPDRRQLREALAQLSEEYAGRGIEVCEVGSGWRIQVRAECAPWVSRLWDERPGRYSRALMETLALIAYRQPITRGEIEEVRGVSVSSHIIKTLLEREWVRVVGHRDVPGRPALYGTTREFLDHFNLKSLDDLPTLAEIRDLDSINRELDLGSPGDAAAEGAGHEQEQQIEAEHGEQPGSEAAGEPLETANPQAAGGPGDVGETPRDGQAGTDATPHGRDEPRRDSHH
jgi:segregation and condensation protein B